MQHETIKVEYKDNCLLVKIVKPRIYLTTSEKFRKECIPLTEKQFKKMVIDFSSVEVMNSMALGVLILTRDTLERKNCPVVIYGLQPLMKDIFFRMRLDLLFTLCETAEEAFSDTDER